MSGTAMGRIDFAAALEEAVDVRVSQIVNADGFVSFVFTGPAPADPIYEACGEMLDAGKLDDFWCTMASEELAVVVHASAEWAR